MNLGTKIYTLLFGKYVGEDQFGNHYYQSKSGANSRRWVIYNGPAEPTMVPPEWHGWLHKLTNDLPSPTKSKPYKWQKKHQPNLSGTPLAYYPPGHVLKGANRKKATGDYVAWNPEAPIKTKNQGKL